MTRSKPQITRVALVTGASTGIGKAVAIRLGKEGFIVGMIARRPDVLAAAENEVAATGAKTFAYAVDVTREADLRKAIGNLIEETGRLDVLVANAGTGSPTPAAALKFEAVKDVIDLNVTGFAACVSFALPQMLKQASGHIVGISSLAAFRGMPEHGAYSASKAFVAMFLESLRVDLRGTGVHVTTVYPGFVRTPMTDKNKFKMPFMQEPEQAAEYIWQGIVKNKSHVAFPFPIASLTRVATWLPNSAYDAIMSAGKPKIKK